MTTPYWKTISLEEITPIYPLSLMDLHQVRSNIRLLRKSKGITQKEIACRLFMDERTYSKIERGEKKSIDVGLLTAIADILHTDITSLLRNTATENPATSAPPASIEMKEQITALQQTQTVLMEVIVGMQEKISKLVTANHAVLELLNPSGRQATD